MLSFIVPAHNEQLWIGSAVRAIHAAAQQVGQPYEIVVVDDASTDGTDPIAAELGARIVRIDRRQIAAARNAGAQRARGDIFFFVDADTLANAAAVRAGLAALRRGAVGGGCVFRYDGQMPLWAHFLYPAGIIAGRMIKLVGGCFLFCTRAAFTDAGGFSERHFAAEDAAFIAALKRQGRFVVPGPTVLTSGRKFRVVTLRETLRLLTLFAVGGTETFCRRENLDLWYGKGIREEAQTVSLMRTVSAHRPS